MHTRSYISTVGIWGQPASRVQVREEEAHIVDDSRSCLYWKIISMNHENSGKRIHPVPIAHSYSCILRGPKGHSNTLLFVWSIVYFSPTRPQQYQAWLLSFNLCSFLLWFPLLSVQYGFWFFSPFSQINFTYMGEWDWFKPGIETISWSRFNFFTPTHYHVN